MTFMVYAANSLPGFIIRIDMRLLRMRCQVFMH